jgi:hypothetical protein
MEGWLELILAGGEEAPDTKVSKEQWMDARGAFLKDAPRDVRGDRTVMAAAVQRFGGNVLRWATEALLSDAAFLLKSLEIYVACGCREGDKMPLQYASKALLADKDFAIAAMKLGAACEAYECFSEEVQQNRAVAMVAATMPNFSIRALCPELRADRELVFEAVRHQPWPTIDACSPDLRADRELVLLAVRGSADVFRMMLDFCDGMKGYICDRDIVEAAVQQDGSMYAYASAELRADKNLLLLALRTDSKAFDHAPSPLQNDAAVRAAVASRAAEEAEACGSEPE